MIKHIQSKTKQDKHPYFLSAPPTKVTKAVDYAVSSAAFELEDPLPAQAWYSGGTTCLTPLVKHYLSNAGFLQTWRILWQAMVILDTVNSA